MTKLLFSFLLLILLLFCFSQNKNNYVKDLQIADRQYEEAEQLSIKSETDEIFQEAATEMFQLALASYSKILKTNLADSLAFRIRLKAGYCANYLEIPEEVKENYIAAIALQKKNKSIADSFLFIPYIYTGGIYYSQNQTDSALLFYKKAEQVKDLYNVQLSESQRLYNRLGAIYYETGNFRQASNYFEKAINLTNKAASTWLVNYKINLASIFVKLEDYKKADSLFKTLLPSASFQNEIYHNLGITSFKLGQYRESIDYLRKVNYKDSKKQTDLYYNFGITWSALNNKDSADSYIQKAISENLKWNGKRKNITYGLILKFQGDEKFGSEQFEEALNYYQQTICQFNNDFSATDIYINPDQFSTVFSYINLFNTLIAKASVFEIRFSKENKIKDLEASLSTYRSAFQLADYIEKTYNSDESRLFLNRIKHTVHSKPIDVSLRLYQLTKEKKYLEEAYLFDQRNKASILSLNIYDNVLRSQAGTNNALINKEVALKNELARLSLKASFEADSTILRHLFNQVRDNEIELEKLQQLINNDPVLNQKRAGSKIPLIKELQKSLDNSSAILSYHLSEKDLIILLITSGEFEFFRSPIDANFFARIDSFKNSLYNTTTDKKYEGFNSSHFLYQLLIAPAKNKLVRNNRLIIIPDDELNYLPFEALQDENRKYLIEKFSIQYQYSTALIEKNNLFNTNPGTLAFAPFTNLNYQNDSTKDVFGILPSTKEEVINLKGKIFLDSAATKNNFLLSANKFNILHLATHAEVNNENPNLSFIALFPDSKDFKLYAQEIYNLKLDSTQLVILSACETGSGKLIKGEGLMSLSRAFAYAGCPNIITSLWKAEDKTTAYITQKLHDYLDKGYTKDKALQKAKLDLLNDTEVDPRYKSPNYWAHLLFIGNYEKENASQNWRWFALILIAAGTILFVRLKRKA